MGAGAMPALSIAGLNAWYGESHILHGVDLTVNEGEVVTLLGRNGAGRTTTLKPILALVIVQTLGRVIGQLKQRGFTIVMVEQNFRFAAPLADRHYVMEHGRIAETFAAAELESKMGMLHEYLGV